MNFTNSEPFIMIDFMDENGHAQNMAFSDPIRIVSTNNTSDLCSALREIQEAINAGYYAAGYISYEAAPAFDSAFVVTRTYKLPLLWFGIFKEPTKQVPREKSPYRFSEWKPAISPDVYEANIHCIKDAISRGETYQVNYTFRMGSSFTGDDFAFYQACSQSHQAKYCAYINMGAYRILSFSPELFFRKERNHITTRPMKGTAKRGRWYEEDEENFKWLATSEKNRAENVMIVDLLRNDLGRIAEVDSVEVPRLFDIERYPTVWQMTSTITAKLRPNLTFADILKALFPCGSITGAPKINTMKLISQLEESPREIYCGTIGVIKPNQDAVFNVAIRTMFINTKTGFATYGTGGGITWDSVTDSEYTEAMVKAAVLVDEHPKFQLLETLRLEHNHYLLLDRHLQRLANSARYFNFPVELGKIRITLDEHAHLYQDMTRRVRLIVDENGTIQVESQHFDFQPGPSLPVAIANSPISSRNRYLYHKTTYRSMYEQYRDTNFNVFDTVLWNENEEITEFTTGNIILDINGKKFTPKISCGLLPGTFRAELLEKQEISETILTRSDLMRANKIWFINSVRGWVPVHMHINVNF